MGLEWRVTHFWEGITKFKLHLRHFHFENWDQKQWPIPQKWISFSWNSHNLWCLQQNPQIRANVSRTGINWDHLFMPSLNNVFLSSYAVKWVSLLKKIKAHCLIQKTRTHGLWTFQIRASINYHFINVLVESELALYEWIIHDAWPKLTIYVLTLCQRIDNTTPAVVIWCDLSAENENY